VVSEPTPELGTIALPSRPLHVEPGQEQLERTFASAEDVRALSAYDAPDEAAAVTGASYDIFDRHPRLCEVENGYVGLLTVQISFILDAFGSGEQIRVDGGCADGGTDLAHGFAKGVDKGPARVLHQVPAISDLCRGW